MCVLLLFRVDHRCSHVQLAARGLPVGLSEKCPPPKKKQWSETCFSPMEMSIYFLGGTSNGIPQVGQTPVPLEASFVTRLPLVLWPKPYRRDEALAQLTAMAGSNGGLETNHPGSMYIMCIYIWLLIKIPLSRNGHSSRIKILLARNFRELHVYLSRGPCWPTTPLMKIRSPPAKLRQRITDHFLVAF